MKTGDVVVCRYNNGYHFTEGKEYTVLKYEEEGTDGVNPFVWPAYVQVNDDYGKRAFCHAHRFILKE